MGFVYPNISLNSHQYYLFSTGTTMKNGTFDTRVDAEIAMKKYCAEHNIRNVECVEHDKHEKKYSNHAGVRFYINRV